MGVIEDVKIILIGGSTVGKTCLVRRFIDDTFNEGIHQVTIGACYYSKTLEVNGKTLRLSIWDTAGSEKYRSMTRLYYRGSRVAIICIDLSKDNGFRDAKYWIEEIKAHEEDCRLYVCGTKKDLTRKIDCQSLEAFSAEMEASCIETSSKTGENVRELFNMIHLDMRKRPTSKDKAKDGVIRLKSHRKKTCCQR